MMFLLLHFTKDGLSVIASKHDTSFMLDAYTTTMCTETWGRLSYVRAMIDLWADLELKDILVVAIPRIEGYWYILSTIKFKYEFGPMTEENCL